MSVSRQSGWTVEQFLDWERGQELRYEFDGVSGHAMTCGTIAHSIIGTNIIRCLDERLRGSPFRALRATPSIQRYVMLEQASMAATVFSRAGESWTGIVQSGRRMLALPDIDIELPLKDFHGRVGLTELDD